MEASRNAWIGRYGVNVLTALFALGALVEDLVDPSVAIRGVQLDRGPETTIAVVLAGAVVLVLLRGRLGLSAPLAAVSLFGLASLSAPAWALDSTFVFLLVMLLGGLCGYLADSRFQQAGLLVVCAAGALAAWQRPDPSWGQGIPVVAFMALACITGSLIRGPIARARSAENRALQLEQEQRAAARQAVLDERRRIARELHDVIAHSVSVMTVQAGAVRRLLTSDQAHERESLLSVEQTGREALTEMRRLVGLLDEEPTTPSYAPQPGMEALDSLITTMRTAGLPVELSVEGEPRPVSPGVDLAAYRVVQEALTNTLKHAGPARAQVRISWASDELQIEVSNDGSRTVGKAAPGYGQIGMRERLRLYGGRLESGPDEQGYVVRAFVPIGADA